MKYPGSARGQEVRIRKEGMCAKQPMGWKVSSPHKEQQQQGSCEYDIPDSFLLWMWQKLHGKR